MALLLPTSLNEMETWFLKQRKGESLVLKLNEFKSRRGTQEVFSLDKGRKKGWLARACNNKVLYFPI